MDFLLWPANAPEMMLFLAIVTCLAICWAFSYTMSRATISPIKYLAWAGSLFIGWGCLSVWWFFFATPIPCTAESFSLCLSCISVASADRTISMAFSRVRSEILSNLSLVLVSLMPSTILSLIREFFNVLNSHDSLSFLNTVTYWSMVSPLFWALEKNLYVS